MAKIRLFDRSEVGPTSAGAVKPGFDLARGAGVAQVGAATAKFAGDIFNDLVATRAANEEAAFMGEVNTAMQGFETFVAANPGVGYDKLEKERDKMFAGLDKAVQTATTRRAQQNNKSFMLRNKELINERTQTSMEAIRAKQELLTYESHRKNFMNNFDRDGLTELNEDMIESGLLNPEVTAAKQAEDFAIIDAAEQKVAISNSVGIGFDAWQTTVTPDDPDGDLNAAFDVIDALDVPEGEKQEIESELKTRVANRRAETKLEAEQADAKSVETINGWINKGELDGIDKRIGQLPLTETRKREEIKKANAHIAAINKGKPSPYEQTDSETYFDLRRKIELDPLSVTEGDLAAVVGKGKGGAIEQDLTSLTPQEEGSFKAEFAKVAEDLNLSDNPDDPLHFYDYRGLFKETGGLGVGPQKHFPSKFKLLGHPNLIVDGKDTRTGEKATPELVAQNKEANAQGESGRAAGGISTDDYEKLLGMIRPDSPLKRPASTRAQAAIQRLRALDITIEVPDLEEGIDIEEKYLRISNDLDDFILSKPEATDDEITKKGIELLTPMAERVTAGFFARMFNRFGVFGRDRPGGKLLKEAFRRDEIPTITTQEDFNALPKGTRYRDRNGNIATKQ